MGSGGGVGYRGQWSLCKSDLEISMKKLLLFICAVQSQAATTVLLDGYHNNETKDPGHYQWATTNNGGLAELDILLHNLGAETRTLRQPVSRLTLAGAKIFIIIDPDTPEEATNPKYIQPAETVALEQWVAEGGRLVLLANDKGNAEFPHLNQLAGKFGIEFVETTFKNAKGEDHVTVTSSSAVMGDRLNAYLVATAPLKLTDPNVKTLIADNGTPLAALVAHGKGSVFAIGDPWIYNEYINRANNREMAENLFRTLIASDVPRSEYPQPQFQRSQWITLNGSWEFAFDDREEGAPAFSRKITIPYCFESKLSGIKETGFHPVAWYRRSFETPAAWKGEHVLLHFGAVDYRAKVWVNGKLMGAHEGGNVPFSFDVTAALRGGPNSVMVRAEDPPEDRTIPRGKQYWKPESEGIFYTRTSGIWQPVWLEATGDAHLDDVHVVAGQDGVAHFDGELAETHLANLTVRVSMFDGGTAAGAVETKVGLGRFSTAIPVTTAKLWSPDSPTLYRVKYELLQGAKVLDTVDSYLGFRTVGIANDRVTVNGKPVYLKLLLDQGYWPESILTPPSEEAMLKDINFVQAMGFNGVRKHQKVEDPRFLYWADRRGLLVSGEIADAYDFSEQAARRFTTEWMSAMKRDYNHPSIIIWNAINESWGTPDLKQPRQQAYLRSLYHLTHTLDPTRLAIDNEGWEHTGDTDLFAIHDYVKSGEDLYNKYKDITAKSESVPKNGKAALIDGYKYNGAPLYLSEMGGIAYIPPGAISFGKSWGYSGVEKTQDEAFARFAQLFQGLAKLHNMAGFCYTQITDVEQEANGLLTYDRKLKFDPAKVKALLDVLQ
jgi:hypothetical protein